MSSPLQPPSIPEINTSDVCSMSPVATPSSQTRHLLESPASTSSQPLLSATSLINLPTSNSISAKVELGWPLLASSIDPSLMSESKDKAYLSTLCPRPPAWYERILSPMNKLVTPSSISPALSSGGSSEAGHSLCSFCSDDLLTLPRFESQDDSENPPYKPRQLRTGSLSMLGLSTTSTTSSKKARKLKRKHRRKRYWKHKVSILETREEPMYLKDGEIYQSALEPQEKPLHGTADSRIPLIMAEDRSKTFDKFTSSSHLKKEAGTNIHHTRRWSSVTTGSIPNKLGVGSKSTINGGKGLKKDDQQDDYFTATRSDRSSRRTISAKKDETIGKLRKRLTICKIQVDLPQSITLRRASAMSDLETAVQKNSSRGSEINSPVPVQTSTPECRSPPEAYLITREDIDIITHLIQSALSRNSEVNVGLHTDADVPLVRKQRALSFTQTGLVLGTSISTDTALTRAEVETSLVKPKAANLLAVVAANQITSAPASPTRSIHELIWQDNGSPHNSSPKVDEDISTSSSTSGASLCSQISDSSASQTHIQQVTQRQSMIDKIKDNQIQYGQDIDNGVAFDPKIGSESTSEPSWRNPKYENLVAIDSPETDFKNDTTSPSVISNQRSRTPLTRNRSLSNIHLVLKVSPSPASPSSLDASSKIEKLTDVVSFPPLPARSTIDWYSPLPPMNSPSLTASKSLYDLGLDANRGQASSNYSSEMLTPNGRRKSSFRIKDNAYIPRLLSVEFDPSDQKRRRSTIKMHPKAAPRVGASFATGSSLGTSSGERRKSSFKEVVPVKRVQTIDNKHKGERQSTWSRVRPPSVCPPPKTFTPPESTLLEEGLQMCKEADAKAKQSNNGILTLLRLLRSEDPRTPTVDHVGIYGKLTGTKKGNGSGECPSHSCDECEVDPRNPSIDWIG